MVVGQGSPCLIIQVLGKWSQKKEQKFKVMLNCIASFLACLG